MNEKITFRACSLPTCPSATIEGKDVAKVALAIAGFATFLIVANALSKSK